MSEQIMVIITNFDADGTHSYAVTNRESCKDEMDRMVFDRVIEDGEAIKIGQVFGYIEGIKMGQVLGHVK